MYAMTIRGRSVKDLATIVKRNLTKYSANSLLRARGALLCAAPVLAPAPRGPIYFVSQPGVILERALLWKSAPTIQSKGITCLTH